ncbi:permease prefix domain 1-containing protein [Allorhizocola rhizosphaerae]|uniref:permease prefix domain 1-containing protein n=1 Tax=Allorhizocola rhizosphaerae TaxID=1872709 RepID=UPI000E3EC748|nr:permease prefix domain 1-containing protein [Allorhizocola rhizosphaerae]
MTATTPTLTDRYVDALVSRLPVKQRTDIEQELRASISDAVEHHIDAGKDPADAERAVLTELGDPARLAARYTDRSLQLIGPAVYLDYMRLLTTLLVIVVPVVAAVAGFTKLLSGQAAGIVITSTLGAAATTAIHIAFWTTLIFAFIERSSELRSATARQWTPDHLPEPSPTRRPHVATMIAEIVMAVLFAAFLLLSRTMSTQTDANGDPIEFLSPALWRDGPLYALLGIMAVGLVVTVAKTYMHWSAPVAVAGLVLNLAAAAVLVWLTSYDQLLNPAFMTAVGWPADVDRWIDLGLLIAAGIVALQGVAETVAAFVAKSFARPDWRALTHRVVDDIAEGLRRTKA